MVLERYILYIHIFRNIILITIIFIRIYFAIFCTGAVPDHSDGAGLHIHPGSYVDRQVGTLVNHIHIDITRKNKSWFLMHFALVAKQLCM